MTVSVERASFGAQFLGERYDRAAWSVTIGGHPATVEVRLRPGYSPRDHLFDRVLVAIDERLTEKSDWSSRKALRNGLWAARVGCGCDADMTIIIDGRVVL